MSNKNKRDKDGYTYREVTHAGKTYTLVPQASKLTLLNLLGIVYVFPPDEFSFTAPKNELFDGQTFNGYTDQEPFVSEFREMLAEMKREYGDSA